MKTVRTAVLGSVICAMAVLGMTTGEAMANAGKGKIGYVDLQRTLNETKVGKNARARLEREKTKRQKRLDKAQEELKKEFEKLEKQRLVLKDDVLRQKERALQEKYMALQQEFVKAQQELTRKEAQLTQEIFKQAAGIIESIAKREGFTMMLEKNESAVLYADPSTDITSEVNKRLDAKKGKK